MLARSFLHILCLCCHSGCKQGMCFLHSGQPGHWGSKTEHLEVNKRPPRAEEGLEEPWQRPEVGSRSAFTGTALLVGQWHVSGEKVVCALFAGSEGAGVWLPDAFHPSGQNPAVLCYSACSLACVLGRVLGQIFQRFSRHDSPRACPSASLKPCLPWLCR